MGLSETSSDDITHVEHDARNHSMAKDRRKSTLDASEKVRENVNAKLANPLAYQTPEELRAKGRAYAMKHFLGDEEDVRAFEIGACLAQAPEKWERVQGLRPEERAVLEKEMANRWAQPRLMYLVIVLCSLCAAVQGMGKFGLAAVLLRMLISGQMRPSSTALRSSTKHTLVLTEMTREVHG